MGQGQVGGATAMALLGFNRGIDGGRVGAHGVLPAANDHLRGIDAAVAQGGGVTALALRMGRLGQGVLPAQVIPIVHIEGQGDKVIARRQFAQQAVRRRAGVAALRGIQFHHHLVARPGLGARDRGEGQQTNTGK